MDWQPTDNDVRAAYAGFRAPWDFQKQGPLRLPLRKPVTVAEGLAKINETLPAMEKTWQAIITIECGWMAGQRAQRLVGRVPDTEIEVALEMHKLD